MRRLVPLLLAGFALIAAGCEKKSQPSPTETPPSTAQAPGGDVPGTPPPPANSGTLLLGVATALTGGQATFGISTRNGVELAIKEANAAGGVKGQKVAMKVYDNQGKPEESAQAVSRLITQDKVLVILGDVASSNSLAMAEKAQPAGVPMISPASTNPAVTEKGDYIFRVCFIDPFQGFVMAKFARETLKTANVAVLQDNKSAYSIGLTEVFVRKFTEMGGKITTTESFSQGDTDYRAQLTAIKKTQPDAIYVPGYYSEVGIIARQARELGLKVPLLGGDGWDSEKLFELGGSAIQGSYFSNHYSPDNKEPRVQKFVADYKAAYGGVPDALAALGYDAANVAIDALKRAPDTSGPAVRDAIAQTKNFPGIAGTITLDDKRNAVKSAVVLKVGDGKAEFVTTVNP
ncbi:ABC transporter substrate-binding protein [Stigmatella aurantiaca]|uniref:Branched chain amino acid ABC transporter, periplasmic amino acid-binding protein n=1 Tax=Stigmatella aurantiaca (strain DW4/3-1) TaxID=378806 RepID=Q09BF7_STIAD|nr:ABC transporter substrate-binding protein [Stigmatella aurantiaca]ADO69038.1 branched chain amino acid ABC transporter, periplasmic amino acid-binding protein [Stigmatella aurantiaca DW4/3-1]EAU69096.1 branched-chain amino acid ABC transporter, amino acid-binding protein [Stigmatella aurantiaca DW4/3-1]